jgi:hypothetical protein
MAEIGKEPGGVAGSNFLPILSIGVHNPNQLAAGIVRIDAGVVLPQVTYADNSDAQGGGSRTGSGWGHKQLRTIAGNS